MKTTVLPNASAGAIFQAGIAIGKFQGVMTAVTPSGSRGHLDVEAGAHRGEPLAGHAQRLAREELEDLPGAADLADGLGKGLAFLAGKEVAQLRLAGEDLGADEVERVERACGEAAAQAGKAARAAAMAERACASPARAYSSITSAVSDGFTFREASSPPTQSPPIQFRFMANAS